MAIQISTPLRNARLDAVETTVGTSALMRFFSGAVPANCAAADSGVLLCELALPSDWAAAASAGSKAKLGTWQDLIANNSGSFGYFRIYDTPGTTCHMQGTAGIAGDVVTDSASITAGQAFTVTAFTMTEGGA